MNRRDSFSRIFGPRDPIDLEKISQFAMYFLFISKLHRLATDSIRFPSSSFTQ